jgi:hypothetical protein
MVSRCHTSTVTWLIVVFVASVSLLFIGGAPPTAAYEGAFCEDVLKQENVACESQERKEIRRVIGHTTDAWTDDAIETASEAQGGSCRTIECIANTGYLEHDGTGHGFVTNAGPNGGRKVYGYLYP